MLRKKQKGGVSRTFASCAVQMEKGNYESQIENLIQMFKEKDADGIDRYLYRYQDKGFGMLFIALYHALKGENEKDRE